MKECARKWRLNSGDVLVKSHSAMHKIQVLQARSPSSLVCLHKETRCLWYSLLRSYPAY